ncbi:hypothetical protein [Roseovarius sp.]|nr:hypothetical protein [Roseovarius sp.]
MEIAPSRMTGRGTFTFHGHRLSSLFRMRRKTPNTFIFLKILKFCACGTLSVLSIYGKMKAGAA